MGGKFERGARLEHQTLGVQKLAVRSEDYWEYKPEQRVQTIDGVTGVVKHVEDGPAPGFEEYEVVLDRGLGGGRYTASQLSPAPITTAAMEQTAAVDYPELAQILVERPDPAMLHVTAAKADPFGDDDGKDGSDDEPDDDSDDDSSKDDSDSDDDKDSKGSDEDDDSDDDGDAPPWAKKASALFSDLVVTAATDADFRFHVVAAWRDVVAKAKRIRSEGRLRVTLASDGYVFGEVKGDHNVYETGLQRLPGRMAAHAWSCGCKWGAYHWGADDDFSRFAGRMCSHALALQYEAQSRGMFGRDINADEHKPTWVPRKVVVRYDIDADQNRLAPSTAKTANEDHTTLYRGLHLGEATPDEVEHLHKDPVGYLQQHGFDSKRAGIHWTDHAGSAVNFAMDRDAYGDAHEGDYWDEDEQPGHTHGVVLHGKVAPHHILKPGSQEWHDYADTDAIFDHDHPERERTVRGDAPVHITHVTAISSDPNGGWDRETTVPWGHHVTAKAVLSVVARAAVAAGEDRAEVALALRTVASDWPEYEEDEEGRRFHRDEWGDPVYTCHNPHCYDGEHSDGETAQQHSDVYTDWDRVHPRLPEHLHRGMALSLPDDVHRVVHDDSRSTADRAHALVEHMRDEGLGTHWTPDHNQAAHYSGTADSNDRNTHVVLHIHKPDKSAIETDPEELASQDVISFGNHDDQEVPLQSGAQVKLKGISWKHRGDKKWVRHDFPEPVKHTANADDPFGNPAGTSFVQPKAPGATAPRKPWENPASAGPLAGADPAGWNRQLPLQSYAAHGGLEAALFEPGGTEAELHDEPEGALPSTDGAVPTDEASDLTPSMTAGLRRQALKDFTLAEQQALINEGEGVRAANLDRLDIKGTHYADLESVLAAQEEDTTWLA